MTLKNLNLYIKNPRVRQVVGLFSDNILGIPISIVTSIIITRYLGSENYGNYQYVNSIYDFIFIFISFGFFQAGNRALVLNEEREKAREYFGAEFLISLLLFVVLAVIIVLYAFFDSNVEEKQLRSFLLFTIPFGISFILLKYFETLLQADQQIGLLFKVRFFPRIGFLVSAGIIYLFFFNSYYDKLIVVWSLYMASRLLVYGYVLLKLKLRFSNVKQRFTELLQYNKEFGLNMYMGSALALGLRSLTPILVSYFGDDNSGVGYLALATTFSLPLTFIPNTIATTHYKDFSKVGKIPKKITIITLILSFSALFGLWIIVAPFVNLAYGKEFHGVIDLVFVVSLGYTAHGFADFFNRFLGANGQGKALRNSSVVVGISSLIFSLLIIPKWGEIGAAFVKLTTGISYLLIIIYQYYKYLKISNHNGKN